MDNIYNKRYLERQEKYKKIVRIFVLYLGNISYKEISEITGISQYMVGLAIQDYIDNPDYYKYEINLDLYETNFHKKKATIYESTIQDKVEVGINTMKFWAQVRKYKKQLYGNIKAKTMDEKKINRLINFTLKKRQNGVK
jgi:hypothetical protein